jgi:hypothetical protein
MMRHGITLIVFVLCFDELMLIEAKSKEIPVLLMSCRDS